MKLDEKNRTILGLLKQNARLTNRQLARQVGLSPSACLVRVKRLEAAGVIVGYRAIVAPSGRGAVIDGWAEVRLVDPSPEAIADLSSLLTATPEIVEAHRVSGRFDYLIRFCAADLGTWSACRRTIETACGAAQVHVNVAIEALK
jgi:Lrp/AsnC family leucine-responsive transcriptional regulator